MMKEKMYVLPESVRQALAQYLTSRPWREVDPLIRAIFDLGEVKEKIDGCREVASNDYIDQ